jgi:hypothetical protein
MYHVSQEPQETEDDLKMEETEEIEETEKRRNKSYCSKIFRKLLKIDRKQHCRLDGVCSEDDYNDLGVP